ncbi:hypothetical protein XENOCAPTIV_013045 [Xenoophorus captivus]|uniref:Uncharacterized protein n=1 Tax=Xenoophorus captivus TaxID=1517983 RepID=A0ABV0RLA8_9TELE
MRRHGSQSPLSFITNGFYWVEVRILLFAYPCFYGPYLLYWCATMLEHEGGHLQTVPKQHNIVQNVLLCIARVLLTGTKRVSPSPEQQPHTIICSPKAVRQVLLATTKPRLIH